MNQGTKLYRAQQVRELDRYVIEDFGIPAYELMQRAARATFGYVQLMLPQDPGQHRILVVCGGGNNGGDGYLIAALAKTKAYAVDLVALVPEEKLQGDVLTAAREWRGNGGRILAADAVDIDAYNLIIDAILGTGLQRPVEGAYRNIIEQINRASCPVLAVDIPSGLHADTGSVMGIAVKAKATVSFIGLKQGLFTGQAVDYCGKVYYEALDVPAGVFDKQISSAEIITEDSLGTVLSPRRRNTHKGNFGHLLIIGGDTGMAGAVTMAGIAALRCGAGLVSIATRKEHATLPVTYHPELMCHGIERAQELTALLEKATVVAVGPGLGQSAWAKSLFAKVLDSALPLIVDADALNLLARDPVSRSHWVLTPHPGEAARLLGMNTPAVQADRFAAAQALCRQYAGHIVLKGAGTLIASHDSQTLAVCTAGNPGMASGGMGDVLTGVIAGIAAQTGDLAIAARSGVCLHAQAADQAAAQDGERGLLATDLLPFIRRLANPV
jgi:NAD(P)H-hydrate epimerase